MYVLRSTTLRAVAQRFGFIVAIATFAAACAAGTQSEMAGDAPEPAGDGTVEVVVMNNEFNAEEVAVLIEGGVQMSLGSVSAGQTRTFQAMLEPRNYELVARSVTGGEQRTDFQLFGNTTRVTWDMNADRITQSSR